MPNTSRSNLRTKSNTEVKIDRNYKIWSKNEYDDAINEALFEIDSRGDGKWEISDKTTEGATTANQQFYDQPENFLSLKLIEFNDKTLTRTEYENVQRDNGELPVGTPTQYYSYQNKIGLHPIPAIPGTLKVLYGAELINLEEDNDLSPYMPKFDRAIALYTAYILLSQPGDNRNIQRANIKKERFNEEMKKLLKMFLYKDRENMSFQNTYVPKNQRRGFYRR